MRTKTIMLLITLLILNVTLATWRVIHRLETLIDIETLSLQLQQEQMGRGAKLIESNETISKFILHTFAPAKYDMEGIEFPPVDTTDNMEKRYANKH